jgi:hypothetical protein
VPSDWATDVNYNPGTYPGQPGSSPTKVKPSPAQIAQGWLAGNKRPAEFDNWNENRIGRWIGYHDAIEVQNWVTPGVNSATSVVHTEVQALAFAGPFFGGPAEPRFYLANGTTVASSGHGLHWANELTAADVIKAIVTDGSVNHVLAVGDGGLAKRKVTGSWTTLATGEDKHYAAVYAPFLGGFFSASISGSLAQPDVTKYPGSLASKTVIALAIPSGFSTPADTLGPHYIAYTGATIATPILALCASEAGKNPAVWTSTDGTAFTLHRITATTAAILEFFWDLSQGLFYAIDTAGVLYQSSDGATWASAGLLSAVAVDTAKTGTLAVYGSIWVMVLTGNIMAYSGDQGASWNVIVHPFPGDVNEAKQYPVQRIVLADGRFAALGQALVDTDPHWISFSLRCA